MAEGFRIWSVKLRAPLWSSHSCDCKCCYDEDDMVGNCCSHAISCSYEKTAATNYIPLITEGKHLSAEESMPYPRRHTMRPGSALNGVTIAFLPDRMRLILNSSKLGSS